MSSFIKDVTSVGLSNLLIISFGLATSIITARYIGPEGNGIIAGLMVYPSLFMTIGSLGIRQSATYYIGKGLYSENNIKTAITQIWIITTCFSIVCCFFLMYYLSTSGSNLFLVILALLPIPFSLFNTYSSGIFLGKNNIRAFNKINWIPSLVVMAFTFILVIVMDLRVFGALAASVGGPLFMFFILVFKNNFVQSFSFKFNWRIIKDLLSLGIVYAFSLLIINLNYRLDVILLDKMSTAYELGIYSKGASITQYLWQIPMLLSTVVFSRSAVSKNSRGFSFKVAQLLRVSFIIIALGATVLAIFSRIIIIGMYGEKFSESVAVLNFLLPGVIILTIFKVMNMDLAGKGMPWVAMKAMIPSLFVNLLLNILLIPKMGALGAAISSTMSYTLAGVLFLYFYCKAVNISIGDIIRFKKSDFDPLIAFGRKILNK